MSAASGYDGLKRLDAASQSSPVDLVLLDMDVGDMSGIAMAQAIRSNRKIQPAKIVMLSPAAANLTQAEWRQAGIDDCLVKPLRQSTLYESLLMLTASNGTFNARRVPREPDEDGLERLAGNVLLVEDNPVNQAVAVGMLEELGCETVVAINGQDAIQYMSKEEFDVVLMDCEMPVMDGFEATAAIRGQNGDSSKVPIIALTANAVAGDRERCIASGMQDYLSKPISVEKLHGTLKKWLPANQEDTGGSDNVQAAAPEDDRPFDFQLARAVDLLRGVSLFGRKVVN